MIQIHSTQESATHADISKVIALNIKKELESHHYDYSLKFIENEESVYIQLEPDNAQETLLNALIQDEKLFEDHQSLRDYNKTQNNLESYKKTAKKAEYDEANESESDHYDDFDQIKGKLEFEIEQKRGTERNHTRQYNLANDK